MAFVNDIALVIVGKHVKDLQNLIKVSFKKYQECLDDIGQELAEHQTDAALMTHHSSAVGVKLSRLSKLDNPNDDRYFGHAGNTQLIDIDESVECTSSNKLLRTILK